MREIREMTCEHIHFGGPCPKCLEKRVDELEEKIKSMRNCLNCKHVSSDYSGYQCVNQHDYECEVEGKYDQFWEEK